MESDYLFQMSANEDYKLVRVQPGDNLRSVSRASRVNALQSVSKSHVSGDQYARTSGLLRAIGPGWVVNRGRRLPIHGTGVGNFPWKISTGSDDIGTFISVRPGTINNMLPTNMFEKQYVALFGTLYVTVHVYTDGEKPTDARIEILTIPPGAPNSNIWIAPYEFQVLLGVTVERAVFQIIDSALSAQPKITIQSLVDNPQPGRPYTDYHYTWNVTTS